jgi:hypothetical protein
MARLQPVQNTTKAMLGTAIKLMEGLEVVDLTEGALGSIGHEGEYHACLGQPGQVINNQWLKPTLTHKTCAQTAPKSPHGNP